MAGETDLGASPDHMGRDEVVRVLGILDGLNAAVIGGQSINLWAELYHAGDPDIQAMPAMTSKDIDFYDNDRAARELASRLEAGRILYPSAEDYTPTAAVVTGRIGGREILVDFMRVVLGVDNPSDRFVSVEVDAGHGPASILLLHPLDCLRSRLVNINRLRRDDPISINQARAIIYVVRDFCAELIDAGNSRDAYRVLTEYADIIEHLYIGERSQEVLDRHVDPLLPLEAFRDDTRLDRRWLDHNLKRCIDTLQSRLQATASKPPGT